MSDLVKFSRNEWEEFLSEFSELVRKYKLILTQLDLAQTRIEGLHERNRTQIAKSGEALLQVRAAVEKLCEKTEGVLNEER
jgi:uncharacterized protein YutD